MTAKRRSGIAGRLACGGMACLGSVWLLAGCADQPAPVTYTPPVAYPPYGYGNAPAYGASRPQTAPPSPYLAAPSAPYAPPPYTAPFVPPPVATAPVETPPADIPAVNAPSGVPGPVAADPGQPPPQASAPPSGAAPPDDAQRFEALKASLERQGAAAPDPAVQRASQPASSADPNACVKVRTRAGFRDHYGGLNSAGDVAQPCATASP